MRRTEDHHTVEEKAMMLDLIMDEIENSVNVDLKSLPIEYRKDSMSALIGYGIRKTLVDNGFMEPGGRITQRKLDVRG